MATFYYNKGLPKKLRQDIENRRLSKEALFQLHANVLRQYKGNKLGFKRACIIVPGIFLVLLALMLIPNSNTKMEFGPGFFISIGIAIVFLALILLFVKLNFVELNKKQFIKSLEIGYPELAHRLGAESFES